MEPPRLTMPSMRGVSSTDLTEARVTPQWTVT
jgi:hypothetical protein